jgi:Fur family ferric uptake transcriptional regulator
MESSQHMQTSCIKAQANEGLKSSHSSCDRVATGVNKSDRGSLLQELANRGIRITAQRRLMVETIQASMDHLDAASLLDLARRRSPGIDRATVYRTLELLKKLGLIDELDLMHLHGEKHYYEAKTQRDHIHLACFHCKTVQEFSSPLLEKLKDEIARSAGFHSRVIRLEMGGMCQACAASQRAEAEARAGSPHAAAPNANNEEERSYRVTTLRP